MDKLPKHEERLGQYATKASAKRYVKSQIRRHKALPATCYRVISGELIEYSCYTVQLQD